MTWTLPTDRQNRTRAVAGRIRLGAYGRPGEFYWYLNDGNTTLARGYAPTLLAAQQAAEHALDALLAGVKG